MSEVIAFLQWLIVGYVKLLGWLLGGVLVVLVLMGIFAVAMVWAENRGAKR